MVAIEVHSKFPGTKAEIAELVKIRMSFALDRFRYLRRIQVFIEDVNGPKGGTDKRCRILAEFAFATVLVQDTQCTWQSAVVCAMHRVARTAARRLQRINCAPALLRRRALARMSRRHRATPE